MTQSISSGRRTAILIGLFLTLVLPCLGLSRLANRIPGLPPLAGQEGFWWTLVTVVLLFVLAVERRPLSSIGLKPPTWKTLAFGIGGAVAVLAFAVTLFNVLAPMFHLQQNKEALKGIMDTPYWFRVLLVTRAAVVEEILFRGYGIERLQELTGSRLIAGAVTLAAFTYAHLSYWGLTQLIFAGAAGLVLTVLYIWRRDLGANIIAHWLVDGVGLLLPH